MRTSNKILTVAIGIILASLGAYDFSLKTEFEKGDYAKPYRDYNELNYHDFDEIELNPSTAVNIIIVQGPYKVLVTPNAEDFVRVSKKGNRLIIDAIFPDHYRSFTSDYMVYISCPRLSILKTDASYTAGKTQITDTIAHDLRWKPTLLKGFKLDSLQIQADHASNVVLENDQIGYFRGAIGMAMNSGAAITITQDDRFDRSDLDILNKSRLVIQGTGITNLNYKLADSAVLMVNGAAVNHTLKLR